MACPKTGVADSLRETNTCAASQSLALFFLSQLPLATSAGHSQLR